MAWLKIEHETPDKPEVYQIAQILSISPDEVLGKCIRVWRWWDLQSADGKAPLAARAAIVHACGSDPFVTAMEEVGWLKTKGDSFVMVNFSDHTGGGAKARASSAKRMKKSRGNADKTKTQPEKAEPKPKKVNGDKKWHPSPIQARLNRMFRRQDKTAWSQKEIDLFREVKFNDEDLDAVERYYLAEIPDDQNYRRREIRTLLANWPGEVDRARQWRKEPVNSFERKLHNPTGY